MGQFLAIGLVSRVSISKDEMKACNMLISEVKSKLENDLHFNMDIFSETEKEDYFIFSLKNDIFQHELIPMLEKLYPLLYHNSRYSSYIHTLSKLKSTSPSEWMALAEEKSHEEFQIDPYGMYDLLYCDKNHFDHIKISYQSIMLSAEGKIAMEVYGRQFNFFKYCIVQTLIEFSLAKAIRVYITG